MKLDNIIRYLNSNYSSININLIKEFFEGLEKFKKYLNENKDIYNDQKILVKLVKIQAILYKIKVLNVNETINNDCDSALDYICNLVLSYDNKKILVKKRLYEPLYGNDSSLIIDDKIIYV